MCVTVKNPHIEPSGLFCGVCIVSLWKLCSDYNHITMFNCDFCSSKICCEIYCVRFLGETQEK